MSTSGVRTRMLSLLVKQRGVITKEGFEEIVRHARERGLTSGEIKSLLQPASYLERSPLLREHGIGLGDIRVEPEARAAAMTLAHEVGITDVFPGLPVHPLAPEPPGVVTSREARNVLAAALAKGTRLGSYSSWAVDMSGGRVSFATRVGEKTYPAVVFDMPAWKDPAPRDIVRENLQRFLAATDLASLLQVVREVITTSRPYFLAEGFPVRNENERHGIQDARRHQFFETLATLATDLRLPQPERPRVAAALETEKESMLLGRDYVMETGSHSNYWPYWDNFREAVDKMLAQSLPGTDEYCAIKNRLEEIFTRKTVFGWKREIDEQDIEASIGGALVFRRKYAEGHGRRVSLAPGSHPLSPKYEVLSVVQSGMPPSLTKYAGLPVFRDTDAESTLRFDAVVNHAGARAGDKVPAELVPYVRGKQVSPSELGLRPLFPGESPRGRISLDWNQDGMISVAPIEIGWWGHCHNEAPLNALGLDPKRGVDLYRAGPKVPRESARQSYSAEDIWDIAGALASDHEAGFASMGAFGLRQVQVEKTKFVGSRNNGGHWLLLELARPGHRRIRVDALVTELWHKSDPSKRYERPEERFRRDLPEPDGAFAPNPEWVAAQALDEDEITIDALGRRLTVTTTCITLDAQGNRIEKKEQVEIDPASDRPVKLADEIVDLYQEGGGKLVEHWYNPKQRAYQQVVIDVRSEHRFSRMEHSRLDSIPVAALHAGQETAYDSVIDIHEFITKNMGLPFTCDTSSGQAVWNYPVKTIRIDKLGAIEKGEGEKRFRYTTYRLKYTTMGGPSGQASYIIKRDERGNAVRAVALDPMPDFAYRNEHWVCAGVVADANGKPAYNVQALEGGYLTDKGRERLVLDLWRRAGALLHASLAAPGGDRVYVFETEQGDLLAFPDEVTFTAAVATDQALHS
ncbi:MAG: hypothetical protein HY698_19190 [Deltaproteobacteria bacterium]|nr:hypothetical protein [Deltaproteobacteria bacterium]